MALISTIGIGYIFEIFITGPSLVPMLAGSVIPNLAFTPKNLFCIKGTYSVQINAVNPSYSRDVLLTPDQFSFWD
jgi:hypothetical protein